MAIIDENAELPEDDQMSDDSFDTDLTARAKDKNTPIGGRNNRNATDEGENLVARQRGGDKNTPIG